MPFAATWMDLEINILSEVEKDKYHMILLVCGIFTKMVQMNYLQNTSRVIDVENKLMVTKRERRGRDKSGGWTQHIHTTMYKIDN